MDISDACDVCGQRKATTGLNVFGQTGVERIDLCEDCGSKARSRDHEIWAKIRALLQNLE